MCGIVGLISRTQVGFQHGDIEILENLLVLDTLRGLDSTGVFGVDRNRQVGIMKLASHPHHLFACEDWKKFKNKLVMSGRIVIGHNRKATQGSINSANAHPFHENNIVLVHNGTLRGDHKKIADTEVDSHAICHAFNEKGAENVIPTIDGAFAFVWWDIEKNKLMAIRNDERPLHIIMTADLVIFASEPWMPLCLLGRANKKVTEEIELKSGTLYEFDMNGKYTTKELKLKKEVDYTQWSEDAKKHGGVLTLIKNTKDCTPNCNHPPFQTSEDFPKDKSIVCKIHKYELSEKRTHYKIVGKVTEPDLPQIDFVSHIPAGPSPELTGQLLLGMMEGHVRAKVRSYMNSNCGPSLFVYQLEMEPDIKVNNGYVPLPMWQHVVTNSHCSECNARIFEEEAQFTHVAKQGNRIKVMCADCVEDKIPIGEMKNAFSQRRIDALQNAVRVSDSVAELVIQLPETIRTETLH